MQIRDLWCATVLLGCPPTAEVLTVWVEDDYELWQPFGQKLISIAVHAASCSDAERLSAALRLPEIDHQFDDGTDWRSWVGWLPDYSRETPVSIRIKAAQRRAEAAV